MSGRHLHPGRIDPEIPGKGLLPAMRAATDQKAGGSNPSRRTKKALKPLGFGAFLYFSVGNDLGQNPEQRSDPDFDPYRNVERKGSGNAGEDGAHGVGRFPLGVGGDVGVSVQRKARRIVPQHPGDCFYVHTVLHSQRGERVT